MMQLGVIRHPAQRLAQNPLALGVVALLRITLGKTDIDRGEAGTEGAGRGVLRFGCGEPVLL